MKKALTTIVGVILLSWSSLSIAGQSCDILTQGNKHYSSGNYNKALDIYKTIEDIDKIGKEECTSSIYATIATIYTVFGDKALNTNAEKAAIYYKTASKYNRAFAFAFAVGCNLKDKNCNNSTSFWSGK